jgi:hypothetical protein
LAKDQKVASGHNAAKNRLTLLIGGSAGVDFKLKPIFVCHSEKPRALRGKARCMLEIIWKSNSKHELMEQLIRLF